MSFLFLTIFLILEFYQWPLCLRIRVNYKESAHVYILYIHHTVITLAVHEIRSFFQLYCCSVWNNKYRLCFRTSLQHGTVLWLKRKSSLDGCILLLYVLAATNCSVAVFFIKLIALHHTINTPSFPFDVKFKYTKLAPQSNATFVIYIYRQSKVS